MPVRAGEVDEDVEVIHDGGQITADGDAGGGDPGRNARVGAQCRAAGMLKGGGELEVIGLDTGGHEGMAHAASRAVNGDSNHGGLPVKLREQESGRQAAPTSMKQGVGAIRARFYRKTV